MAARSTLLAESSENEFGFAKDSFAERSCGGRGNFVPVHVFHNSTGVANEMMMLHEFGVESRGTALNGHFSHQARLHQIPQIVVSSGSRTARVPAIDCLEDFGGSGMAVMFQQNRHDGISLRRAAQAAALQRASDFLSVQLPRLSLILNFVNHPRAADGRDFLSHQFKVFTASPAGEFSIRQVRPGRHVPWPSQSRSNGHWECQRIFGDFYLSMETRSFGSAP